MEEIEDVDEGSSSSSDGEVINAIVALTPHLSSLYAKEPRNTSLLGGLQYFSELMESSNAARFYDMAHMTRSTFESLLAVLERTRKLRSTERVSSGEKLMVFLRMLCGTTNRVLGERWQISGSTVSGGVHEVLAAFNAISADYITPQTTTAPQQILSNPKFYPYFADCVGALDGTHIPAIVPTHESAPYRNRKGFISQNVLGVCDFDMVFTFILAGWEGSAHDGRVLNDALQHGFPSVPGKYYLADAGYSLTANTLTPYRGVRYHLKEWETGSQRPQTKEELFNLRHSMLRNVIERAFGVIKRKFPVLRCMLPYPFETQIDIVLAAFTIHNFIRKCNEPPGPLDRGDTVEDLDQSRPSAAGDGEVDNAEMKTQRDSIAKQMWTDYLVYIARRDSIVVV